MNLPYRKLKVWQRAHALAMDVLELAERPDIADRFYLRNQVCSAAMSVPANIAEGNGRGRPLDYASFIDRARGSAFELDTWLYTISLRGYSTTAEYNTMAQEIFEITAMLKALRDNLRAQHEANKR